jgi:hypothetical protein
MTKKKKKEKKEKKEKKKKPIDSKDDAPEEISEYSLDNALSSAKTTETTLQTLLKGVSEGKGFVKPKKKGEVKITPQLSHESRSKIAEAYVLEDVPLVERQKDKEKDKTPITKEKKKESGNVTSSEIKPKTKDESVESKVPSPKEVPSTVKGESIYIKLTEFFEGLLASYSENYDLWEMSISNILTILRKMRKITKKNTDDLVLSINNVFDKIQANLEQFKIKRDEIEKIAEVDIESMSSEFKRVLGMLELQIKEYQLKKVTDEYIHDLKSFL